MFPLLPRKTTWLVIKDSKRLRLGVHNSQDLTVLTEIPDPVNKGDVIYQIPIEDARKLLKEELK